MSAKYYKHPKFGHVYGEALRLPECRCAWPALVTPKDPPPPLEGQTPGAPRYELTFLTDPTTKGYEAFIAKLSEMCAEMLELYNQGKKAKLSDLELTKDGDDFDLEKYPYYEGKALVIARNVKKPLILDANKKELEADAIKGGNIVTAVVTPLITAHGLSFKLNVVQFIKDDGVKFGGTFSTSSYTDLLDGPKLEPQDGTDDVDTDDAPEAEAAPPVPVKKGKARIADIV